LGFGAKLVGRKIGETEYKICAIPLGRVCKTHWRKPEEEVKEEDRSRSLHFSPYGSGFDASVQGLSSIFFLLLLFSPSSICWLAFLLPSPLRLGEVSAGLRAEEAGLKKGDLVLSINAEEVSKWEDLSKIIRASKGNELPLQGEKRRVKGFRDQGNPRAGRYKRVSLGRRFRLLSSNHTCGRS